MVRRRNVLDPLILRTRLLEERPRLQVEPLHATPTSAAVTPRVFAGTAGFWEVRLRALLRGLGGSLKRFIRPSASASSQKTSAFTLKATLRRSGDFPVTSLSLSSKSGPVPSLGEMQSGPAKLLGRCVR